MTTLLIIAAVVLLIAVFVVAWWVLRPRERATDVLLTTCMYCYERYRPEMSTAPYRFMFCRKEEQDMYYTFRHPRGE